MVRLPVPFTTNPSRLILPGFWFLFGLSLAGPQRAQAVPSQKPDSAYHYYLRALLQESQGNLATAVEDLEKAIALTPNNGFLHRTAAEIYFRMGLLKEAVDAIEKAAKLEPDEVKTLVLAGQIYWSLGQSEQAEKFLNKAVKLAPDETEPLINLAGAITSKDPHRAIKLYSSYLERHPGEVSIQERVAQLYQGLGEIENAEKAWEKALEWSPNSLRAHLALAQISEVKQDTTTAISHYEAVLTQDPTNLPLLLRVGELRYRNDDMSEAYEAFSRAQTIAPKSAAASFWLALLAEHRGEWNEAIKLLEQVAAKSPEAGVLLRLSYYYSHVNQYKEAIATLKKLVESEPQNPDFQSYLAMAYEQNRQFSKAEEVLEDLVALDPKKPESYFHLATLYDRMGKFSKAESNLKKAIELKPDYHMALNYLGYSYADRNIHLDEAEKMTQDAIGLNPSNPAYLDSMGWVYYRQGKLQKAEDFLRQAILEAQDPLIWEHLGDVLLAQGRVPEAILSWDESIRIEPGQKKLNRKIKKNTNALSTSQKLNLFIKRSLTRFIDVRELKGLVQITVCDKKPCFNSRAEFSYEQKKTLVVQIPGPLTGPIMMLTKPYNQPAQYGAIHPLFQPVEYYVTRACDRIESLITGDVFHGMDIAQLKQNARDKNGALVAEADGVTVSFKTDTGNLAKIEWKGSSSDELRIEGAGNAAATGFPSALEWLDKDTNVSIRLKFINPVLSLESTTEDRERNP